jgi:threonine dehydrogenase-like Zn-dependent dehydrogenase
MVNRRGADWKAARRAVVVKEPGVLKLESVPDATPDAGEVLLRVMGHEFAALGEGVEGWKVGERVVSLPYMSCGACEACRHGGRSRRVPGTGTPEHAMQSSFVTIAARAVTRDVPR